jgi:hypothetical protein
MKRGFCRFLGDQQKSAPDDDAFSDTSISFRGWIVLASRCGIAATETARGGGR